MNIWSNFLSDLRLKGQGRSLSPEIYLELKPAPQGVETIPIHPAGFSNSNKIVIRNWPTADQWQQILSFFPFINEIEFSIYYANLHSILHSILKEPSSQSFDTHGAIPDIRLENIIVASGYSDSKEKDIIFIGNSVKVLQDLRLKKKVPVKVLKLLSRCDQTHLLSLSIILIHPQLKTNIVRNIVDLWIDLSVEKQKNLLDEWNALLQQTNLQNFSTHVLDAVNRYRYPQYSGLISQVEALKSQLPFDIQLSYDKNLEESFVLVSIKVTREKSFEKQITTAQQDKNIELITKITNLVAS